MTLLKKLSSTEAECVIERLSLWARLQLEDKEHISDEVRRAGVASQKECPFHFMYLYSNHNYSGLNFKHLRCIFNR